MSMCEMDEYRTISELRKRSVISRDGLKIGRIIDVVFDSNYRLHSFILGGSRWEELREFLGIIEDIDPVIPADAVLEVTEDSININIPKDKLKHKLEEGVIPEDAFTYKELKRKKIFDKSNQKFGKVVNLIFLPCGEPAIIIGGTGMEEFAESIKFEENIDLLLPLDYIDYIDDKGIKMKARVSELQLTKENKPMDRETQRVYLNSLKRKGEAKTQLLMRPRPEEFHDFARFS
ncbi:MAG: PRC-barrel domain-containing protein [Candidatus Heimdallarchaeota archaeon]